MKSRLTSFIAVEKTNVRPEARAFILIMGLFMIAATLLSLIAMQLAVHFHWQVF